MTPSKGRPIAVAAKPAKCFAEAFPADLRRIERPGGLDSSSSPGSALMTYTSIWPLWWMIWSAIEFRLNADHLL
jgi:hypothetical protein